MTVEQQAVSHRVELITPEIAEAMLARNSNNRNLRPKLVEAYAKDMAKGNWQFTGEAIKFSEDGVLQDGQHRLAAVVKSGRTVRMLVIRGLSGQAQTVMDTGAKRSSADALRLNGEMNVAVLASLAKMVITDGARLATSVSTTDIMRAVEADPSIRWVASRVFIEPLNCLRRLTSPSAISYAYWRLHKIDPYATAEFFTKLATLVNLPEGSPILALHRRLLAHERTGDGRAQRREVVTYIFMAWNAWRRNETRSLIKLAYSGGELSVPEPK